MGIGESNLQELAGFYAGRKWIERGISVDQQADKTNERNIKNKLASKPKAKQSVSRRVYDVTVIIPARILTHEDVDWLKEAIDSVQKQTKPCKIILVFNGGDEKLEKEISRKGITIRHCDEGLSRARNTGIKECKTEWFFPLDANDWLPPNAIETLWENRPEEGYLYGSTVLFRGDREGGDSHVYKARPFELRDLMKAVYFPNGALQRKSDWEEIGGYDESLPFLEDWDYWLTAAEKGICGQHITEIVYWYRQHNGIVTSTKQTDAWDKIKTLIRQKHPIFKGEIPMGCCGKKTTIIPLQTIEQTVPVAPDGTVMLKYVGGNVGTMKWYGAVTKRAYKAGGSSPYMAVDPSDVKTGLSSNPGFLEMASGGKFIFELA